MQTTIDGYQFRTWFVQYWSRTALPCSIVLLLIAPIVYQAGGILLLVTCLQLVIYMIHQYEEHAEGKFRVFANQLLAGGEDKIGDMPIFWVNIVGVWLMYLLIILLASFVAVGIGLVAAYTTFANALLHIVGAIVQRKYNPGLISSIVLFLPLSLYAIYSISQAPETTWIYHAIGITAAILLHALTIIFLRSFVGAKSA